MPFVKVADAGTIPEGQGRLVEVAGTAVAVFNRGGDRFFACGAICPHEDGPMAEGWLEGNAVVCPWHGFDFDLGTGHCGVAEGLSVPVYPARLSGDVVEVDLP